MAIAKTGAIYKALEFDNVSSRNYGVYITGEAVYNAPKRDVEMITIPGRNGSFALDNGRFENVEVTYPAGIFADNETDFAKAISDFRNFLCSKRGYCRLEDDYNPDEYRMAIYKSGLEVTPAQLKAGEFEITFDCKPQRWLTSGETAVAVTSGDTLTNPTLFESGPLLEATGSGAIEFNGYEIEFAGIPYGEVKIGNKKTSVSSSNPYTDTQTLDTTLLNNGDAIYPEIYKSLEKCYAYAELHTTGDLFFFESVVSTTNALDAYTKKPNYRTIELYIYPDLGSGFVYGTPKTITSSAVFSYDAGNVAYTETVQVTITYGGADTYTITLSSTGTLAPGASVFGSRIHFPTMYGDSTQPIQGVPIYIDCDLGEAYLINGTEYVSLNHRIDLGSELPKLASGSNTVTFDNTITQLKITPRWWKV